LSDTELVLFSGGPDSTILLKHFLQQKKKIRVLYIEMGYDEKEQHKIKLQNEAVDNVLSYLNHKYGGFEYSQASIFTSLNEENHDKYFAKDQQWCAFFGSIFCNNYNIKKMWTGNFSYTNRVVKERDNKSEDYLNGDDLKMWMQCATKFLNLPPEYCTPRLNYNGTGIDKFKDKKEAWDSLEIDLKKLVRSCVSDQWYCGKCHKCWTSKNYGLRDKKGNPL
tara:strand:+ start:1018 stop:1680 length:663 start_codon:yes stop_codon:yes gene_type:complete